MTGAGHSVRVTPTKHPDLFWALCGGRGGAGIVTAIKFDLVPLRRVWAGSVFFDGGDAGDVLHRWREWSATLPDEATTSLALLQLPEVPQIPTPIRGRWSVAVRFTYIGDPTSGAALLAPMRAVAGPLIDDVSEMPFANIDAVHSDPVEPQAVHTAGTSLRELSAATVDALLAAAGPESGSALVSVELRRLGGALSRPAPYDSALCGRQAACTLFAVGMAGPRSSDEVVAGCERLLQAVVPWSTGGALPNFGGGAEAYDEPTRRRLREVVLRHDPGRVLTSADVFFSG